MERTRDSTNGTVLFRHALILHKSASKNNNKNNNMGISINK